MDTAPQTARLVVRVLLVSCLIGGTLFGVSGRLDWAGAWFLLVVAASYSAATAVYFSRSDPDLLRERMSRPSNVPAWDRVIIWFYPLLIGSLFVTAAFDARRRPGQSFPLAVQLLGGTGLIVTLAVLWWCTATNHFLATFARIQDDRGHRVVDGGPYAFVRHPMYAASIVLLGCLALLLGSWRALVPAALMAVVLVVRTRLEDRMLQNGLAGYREFATRVRYRLIPRIW